MAANTISLPKGFVIDKPAGPNLPSGFVLDQPQVARQQFGQSGIVSRPVTTAETEADSQLAFENEYNRAAFKRSVQTRAILKLGIPDRDVSLQKLSPLQLLEAAAQLRPFRDFRIRLPVIKALRRKGIPDDIINDFVVASKSDKGVKGIMIGEIPETTGEIAGSLVGLRFGHPVKGAAIGRAAGSALEDVAQRIFITERQKSIGRDITDVSLDGAEGLLSEYLSTKLFKFGARLLKPAGRTKKFGVEALQETLEKAGKKVTLEDIPEEIGEIAVLKKGGVGLVKTPVIPPGAATTSKLFATLDNISDKAVTSMGRIQETRLGANIPAFIKRANDVLDSFADDLVKQLDPAELGAALNNVIDGKDGIHEAARGMYRQFYTQLDDLGVGVVSNKKAKSIAQKLVDLVESGKLLRGSDESATFVRNVSGLAQDSTFGQSITNRSTLLEWGRKFDAAGERNAARLVGELGGAIDNAMEIAARQHSPGAVKLWRRGNAVFKAVDRRFSPQVITQLAKQAVDSPELARATIFQNELPSRVLKVKKILLSPIGKTPKQVTEGAQLWKQLQRALVESIYKEARSTDGIIFGKVLQKAMDDLGDDVLKAAFNPQQIKDLREIGRIGSLIQGQIRGEGGMLIQLAQPGAVAGVATGTGGIRATALAILAIPQVWARMSTNPRTSKILIRGLADINKFGIQASTVNTTKLLKLYFAERKNYLKEQLALRIRREDTVKGKRLLRTAEQLRQIRGF